MFKKKRVLFPKPRIYLGLEILIATEMLATQAFFLTAPRTINADRYCKDLTKLRGAIKRKRPGKLSKKVLLLHDNARPHSAAKTKNLLENFKWDIFDHPLYSPDLAPSDFRLFPLLKESLGGKHFCNNEDLKTRAVGDSTKIKLNCILTA